ncbi:MAG: DNA polymerase I [candidate division Zixibacteria bacterium]|nr:DNA polymerase I [candidate division Zixibacteria bacterium]NIR65863.1 DNA polymerase I [candidate division Zixibacteria bacterium]NIS16501.1 DNA polymerase I [candidate division Zixibacteria bacterium]NIS47517.1 DNA polymerase I [candidate division Zixibacteria bacterium]NIT52874.1 DNA polymerase I [candidate division Zixibacteria bacterium]
MSDKKTVILVDGSALAYRSFFAFIRNPLINSKGENTSVSFGFINSLWSILQNYNPTHLAVVFDTKAPTHRHEMYKEYKSTRAKMPEDMADQLPRLHEIVEAMNIPLIEKDGVEADDVIATLATQAAEKSYDVLILTSDKDFNQLVTEKIKILKPQKTGSELEIIDRDGVVEKLGVPPEKVVDLMGLMGDTSDNIPGIPGVGPKTALKLIEQFGSLEAVVENADEISAKGVRNKVKDNVENARLSKELVKIIDDVELDLKVEDLKRGEADAKRLREIFLELEFNRFIEEILGESPKNLKKKEIKKAEVDYKLVNDIKELKRIISEIKKRKEMTIDTETTSLTAIGSDLVGASISLDECSGWYIPLGHDSEDVNLPFKEALGLLKPVLEDEKIKKIGQNLKYDYQVFANYEIDMAGIAFDTMVASYLINPSSRQHNLGRLALEHLNYTVQPITELIGSGKKQLSFSVVPVKKATFYAVEDVDITLRVKNKLAPLLKKAGMQKLFDDIEVPLIEVLAEIELAGVRIDKDILAELSREMESVIAEKAQEIYDYAGYEFNINSTHQLQEILFEKLGLKPGRKTEKKKGFSTDQATLEALAKEHPLPQIILNYRQLSKLKSTYIDAIPLLINKKTGRVHTSFNQTVTATGRLSSSDPNLQNIPIRTEQGAQIRKAFVPRNEDYILLGADYSQVELRIMAHISQDEKMLEAFRNDEDIHSRTASEVYGVPIEQVDPDMRRMAKTANFAVIYGVSAYGLSQQSDMSVGESKQFIDTYFARYPGIRKYMESTIENARKDGYVSTMFGRRRYVPEINSRNRAVRQFAERTAINTPIQGTAADIIKIAMIEIYRKIREKRSKMILQVHDELVFDVHKDEHDEIKGIVRDCMENSVSLDVPIKVDMGTGPTWLECK